MLLASEAKLSPRKDLKPDHEIQNPRIPEFVLITRAPCWNFALKIVPRTFRVLIALVDRIPLLTSHVHTRAR